MIENIDYQMIPSVVDEAHWNIRILKGEFVETVIAFDKIYLDKKADKLKFTFNILFTPDPDLTIENTGLQLHAGSILYNLIESADNDKPRTDNP
jgi:hypothetical protein